MLVCFMAIMESGIAMWKGVMAGNHAGAKDLAPKAIVSYEDFGKAAFGKTGASGLGKPCCAFDLSQSLREPACAQHPMQVRLSSCS